MKNLFNTLNSNPYCVLQEGITISRDNIIASHSMLLSEEICNPWHCG